MYITLWTHSIGSGENVYNVLSLSIKVEQIELLSSFFLSTHIPNYFYYIFYITCYYITVLLKFLGPDKLDSIQYV